VLDEPDGDGALVIEVVLDLPEDRRLGWEESLALYEPNTNIDAFDSEKTRPSEAGQAYTRMASSFERRGAVEWRSR
jgi:hypothetical protein